MIIRPEQMDFSRQTFSAIIYGAPGLGKTTLALSAPNPVLIDFDGGISRVKAQHRVPTIMAQNYEEVLSDVNSAEIRDFETVVIDTGGAFIAFLKDWAMRTKGAVQKNGEFNALKGFGFVKNEFESFTDQITKALHKNVIYVFHSVEQMDRNGNPEQRLLCEGATKNTVWNKADFGGYMEVIGNQRYINFTQEEGRFAKGTKGIEGRILIPTLDKSTPNDFFTRLFDKARAYTEAEKAQFDGIRERYETVMQSVRAYIADVVDAESANEAVHVLPELVHVLTSKREASALLKQKADALGLKWDVAAARYVSREA